MKLHSLNYNHNKNKEKLKKARILITIIYIIFVAVSFLLIFKENKKTVSEINNLIVTLDYRIDVLLFFSITPIFIDIVLIKACNRLNIKQIYLTKGKLVKGIIISVVFNIIFGITFFNNLTDGYVTQDAITQKNIFLGSNENKFSEIKYVDIDLKQGRTGNYYIEYSVVFNNNNEIELSDYDSCSYDKLVIINKAIEKTGAVINRDLLSHKTKNKVIKWCLRYPDTLDSFNYLLKLNIQ